jgi:parvulin-like peptidyl-prolyl isomerase
MKLIFSTALVLTLVTSIRTSAETPRPATTNAPDNPNPIIVKGKGFEIRRSDLDQVLATARARYPNEELPSDAAARAISQLIEIQLVLSKATDSEKAEGMKKAEEKLISVEKEFSPAEMEQRLKATHMTVEDLRLKFSQEITAQQSLARQLAIHVTDEDAKAYFDTHPGAYDQPALAHVREILLLTTSDFTSSAAPPLPADTIAAKRRRMDELLERVRLGEDFAALARQYNEDPLSKKNGGELSLPKEQMEFGDLAFSMQPKQISGVLTNEDGFRIFQLLEIIPAKKAEFVDVAGQIKSGLIGEQKRQMAPAYIIQLKKEADIEILDARLKAAVAASEAEMAANAKRAADAQAAASAEANTPAQKAAEAKAFGAAATQSPGK